MSSGTLSDIQNALECFRSSMNLRPDLLLQASDLSGELPDMFRVLYILERELQEGSVSDSMLHLTTDLNLLVTHFRLITTIMYHIASGQISAEELQYYKDANVSTALFETILGVNPQLKAEYE